MLGVVYLLGGYRQAAAVGGYLGASAYASGLLICLLGWVGSVAFVPSVCSLVWLKYSKTGKVYLALHEKFAEASKTT